MLTADVKIEVEAEGYKLEKVIDTLPRQHIIFFSRLAQVAAVAAARVSGVMSGLNLSTASLRSRLRISASELCALARGTPDTTLEQCPYRLEFSGKSFQL